MYCIVSTVSKQFFQMNKFRDVLNLMNHFRSKRFRFSDKYVIKCIKCTYLKGLGNTLFHVTCTFTIMHNYLQLTLYQTQ